MGNAPNKTEQYSQLVEDFDQTKPSSTDELTFCLEPFGPCRARLTSSAGERVTLKIHQSHAELWHGSTKQPTERWALCNIASWGHTSEALRLVVETVAGRRCIYDFKTTEGEHVTSALKQFTDAMVQTLRQAKLRKVRHQTIASCCNKNKAEAINAPADLLVNLSPADGAPCLAKLPTSVSVERTISKAQSLTATHKGASEVVVGEVGPNIFTDHKPTEEDATPVLLSPRSAMAA